MYMETVSQDQRTKTCTKCGELKPFTSEFFYTQPARRKNGSIRIGLHPECKDCSCKTSAKYYRDPANRPNIKRKSKEYMDLERARAKDEVFRYYGGWVCACCGETERLFLHLDHINNDGNTFRKMVAKKHYEKGGGGGSATYRWLRSHGFPQGYQVLCANCNMGKQMNNGVCPHVDKVQRLELNARKPEIAG